MTNRLFDVTLYCRHFLRNFKGIFLIALPFQFSPGQLGCQLLLRNETWIDLLLLQLSPPKNVLLSLTKSLFQSLKKHRVLTISHFNLVTSWLWWRVASILSNLISGFLLFLQDSSVTTNSNPISWRSYFFCFAFVELDVTFLSF